MKAGWWSCVPPADCGDDGAGVGEVVKHRVGSGCREVVGSVSAGCYRDDPRAAFTGCGYVVRGVADQDRLPVAEAMAMRFLGAQAGDGDEVGAGVVVGAVGADVEVEIPVQA